MPKKTVDVFSNNECTYLVPSDGQDGYIISGSHAVGYVCLGTMQAYVDRIEKDEGNCTPAPKEAVQGYAENLSLCEEKIRGHAYTVYPAQNPMPVAELLERTKASVATTEAAKNGKTAENPFSASPPSMSLGDRSSEMIAALEAYLNPPQVEPKPITPLPRPGRGGGGGGGAVGGRG